MAAPPARPGRARRGVLGCRLPAGGRSGPRRRWPAVGRHALLVGGHGPLAAGAGHRARRRRVTVRSRAPGATRGRPRPRRLAGPGRPTERRGADGRGPDRPAQSPASRPRPRDRAASRRRPAGRPAGLRRARPPARTWPSIAELNRAWIERRAIGQLEAGLLDEAARLRQRYGPDLARIQRDRLPGGVRPARRPDRPRPGSWRSMSPGTWPSRNASGPGSGPTGSATPRSISMPPTSRFRPPWRRPGGSSPGSGYPDGQ